MADEGPDDWIAPPTQGAAAPAPAHDGGVDDWISPPAAQPSTGADIVHGGNRGLIEGFGSLIGMPADVVHLIDKGSMAALTYGAEKAGLISSETGQAVRERKGYPAEFDEQLRSDAINKHLLSAANAAGVNTDQPTTRAGQYAETIGSFVPGAMSMGEASIPGMLKSTVKNAVLPGALSETAGQATQGTAAEPYARAAGAMAIPTMHVGASQAARMTNPMARSMEGVSDQQMQAAQQLLDQSRQAGAPLTTAEAVQQVTGGATRAGDLQRVAEQSPEGGAILKPFFAQRPQQTEALGRSAMREIAPNVGLPYGVAPRVQGAAEGVVNDIDQARSAAVKPLYQAAAQDAVPADQMENFLGKIDTIIAKDKTGLISPQLERFRDALTEEPATRTTPRVPITDIENLDNARKFFRDEIAQPAIAQDAVPKQIGAKLNSLLSDLNGMMENASPNFLAGKQRYQDITRDFVQPLQQSPTGQLASAETFPKQAQILFNASPLPGSEKAVGTAVRQISARDPVAAQQMVRMYLEKTFNEATQDNMTGPNQFGGPKFASIVAGNPQQAKNLEASVRALPNGSMRWDAFKKSLDIFEAMGTRQPAGSLTAFNQQLAKSLEGMGAIPGMAATAASPQKWLSVASDIYKKYAYERNTAQLAQAMVSGSVNDLRRVVGSGSNSTLAQATLIAMLVKEGAQSGHSPPSGSAP